jgi:zinc/manganese transport system permease protein
MDVMNLIGFLRYDFVQNAFLAGSIVAVVAAVVGYFVVLRAEAFAGEALADIGFTGASGAALFGAGALLGMFGFTLLAALGMGALGKRVRGRDVEIGMVLSFVMGIGVLFLSLYTHGGGRANTGLGILFGSILSISRTDLLVTLGCSIAILLAVAFLFRPLLFASVDPEVAEARGVPVRLLSVAFLVVLGITTAECALTMGVLLVFALLIAPAAAASHLTHRPLAAIGGSIALGLALTWGGLVLAFAGTGRYLPASFYISAAAAISYFVAVAIGRLRAPQRRPEPAPHPRHGH